MTTDLKERLLGRTIVGYDLAPSGNSLRLELDGNESVVLTPVGECCSSTWIESLDAPAALQGTVQDVEEIPMPNLGNIDGQRYHDVDQVAYYGLRITTNHGRCVIDYRNDSNGYYGGWLEVEA